VSEGINVIKWREEKFAYILLNSRTLLKKNMEHYEAKHLSRKACFHYF